MERIVGSAGLELYPDGALLALRRGHAAITRVSGLGHDLTRAAIDLARTMGAPAIYLLTTTAEGYFPKFGFERIRRATCRRACRPRWNSPPPVPPARS